METTSQEKSNNISAESERDRPVTTTGECLTHNTDNAKRMAGGDQDDANAYLEKHKIQDVLSILTSSLVYTRPFNSRRHMANYLKELKDIRDAYARDRNQLVPHGPADPLFTDGTLHSVFQTADVTGCGHINTKTAVSLAGIVGIEAADALFEHCSDIVPEKLFVDVVHEALLLKTAAFYDTKEKYRTKL